MVVRRARVQDRAAEVRGPHAERTAAMRKRVIDAAIECLGKLGYGATTLQVVTDAADVSRGAMLHHFPSKVDLMAAVAEYAGERQGRYVRRRLADVKPGMDRYLAITSAHWDSIARPPAIALLEIIAAARSDRELGARMIPIIEVYDAKQREAVWAEAESAGITDRGAIEAMVHLHIAAMRGLALSLPFSRSNSREEAAMDLLRRYKRGLTNDLVGRKA